MRRSPGRTKTKKELSSPNCGSVEPEGRGVDPFEDRVPIRRGGDAGKRTDDSGNRDRGDLAQRFFFYGLTVAVRFSWRGAARSIDRAIAVGQMQAQPDGHGHEDVPADECQSRRVTHMVRNTWAASI